MSPETLVAWWAIAVAALVAGMWTASLSRGGVPELQTKPWEIRHHVAAEALMAATLLPGGAMTLLGVDAGPTLLALGLGMTLYSVVNSSGYYVQRRQWPPVAMFAIVFAATAAGAVALLAG